ncbi:hypothetical protein GS531_15315 [Rhodococcus hoagii]|nr:hypothetical protein [Prescottella equi]
MCAEPGRHFLNAWSGSFGGATRRAAQAGYRPGPITVEVVLDPNGPLPPEIYWRRRALAIGAAVVVLALIVWIVLSIGGGDDDSRVDRRRGDVRADGIERGADYVAVRRSVGNLGCRLVLLHDDGEQHHVGQPVQDCADQSLALR